MSLDKLSPTAVKIGLLTPFLMIVVGVMMAAKGLSLPPTNAFDMVGSTAIIGWVGVSLIRRFERRSRTLWFILGGFLGVHVITRVVLWQRTAHLGGMYFALAAAIEIYLLGWLLTWAGMKKKLNELHRHKHLA